MLVKIADDYYINPERVVSVWPHGNGKTRITFDVEDKGGGRYIEVDSRSVEQIANAINGTLEAVPE